jgi:hypothetical protein
VSKRKLMRRCAKAAMYVLGDNTPSTAYAYAVHFAICPSRSFARRAKCLVRNAGRECASDGGVLPAEIRCRHGLYTSAADMGCRCPLQASDADIRCGPGSSRLPAAFPWAGSLPAVPFDQTLLHLPTADLGAS